MTDSLPQNDQLIAKRRLLFQGQLLHLVALAILLTVALSLVDVRHLESNRLLGLTAKNWFVLSLVVPVVHQWFVWFIWRTELCFGLVSRSLGRFGFAYYAATFAVLILARPLVILGLGIADVDTLEIPRLVSQILTIMLGLPAIYTIYSVKRYFSIPRAMGIDHFDPSYRSKLFVRKGIFRFTSNAMYLFGFLGLWAIAFACHSWTAVVSAGFSHAYIWVHYFCTEKPDIEFIYDQQQPPDESSSS